MSANEMIAEKAKNLPEIQAQSVLAFIDEISASPVIGAAELMRLPSTERRRILANQARQAEGLYRHNPELIVEDLDELASYE